MIILSCEHAVNTVPEEYASFFTERAELLDSHSGWDPGASELAESISTLSGAPLYEGTVTRLLVDLNRSPDNAKGLLSTISRKLPAARREEIIKRYYKPFRQKVEAAVRGSVERGERVLHISVHTFAPVMKGKERRCHVGILYDSARSAEREFSVELKKKILSPDSGLIVRLNYPYHGKTDGHTAYMRRLFQQDVYIGIEVEVNQTIFYSGEDRWEGLKEALSKALSLTCSRLGWEWHGIGESGSSQYM